MAKKGRIYWTNQRRRMRRRVIERDGLVCWLCTLPIATEEDVTLDHVIPVKDGGLPTLENLRPAHRPCNMARGWADFIDSRPSRPLQPEGDE